MSDGSQSGDALPVPESVKVVRARALSYRARRSDGRGARNYVVQLTARDADGGEVVGVGEGLPRWSRTGDDAGSSWAFLVEAARYLEGLTLTVSDRDSALSSIRRHMASLRQLAQERAVDAEYERPFRGTLLGVEVALLDVAARALRLTLAGLLGKVRAHVPEDSEAHETLGMLLAAAAPRRAARTAVEDSAAEGESQNEGTIRELENSRIPPKAPIRYQGAIIAKRGPQSILKRGFNALPVRHSFRSNDQLIIDKNVQDTETLRQRGNVGVLRAINVRPAQCGGILPALDLVRAVHADAPGAIVSLSGLGQVSRISASATHQLALALPRVDVVSNSATVEHTLPLTEVHSEQPKTRTDAEYGGALATAGGSQSEDYVDETDVEEEQDEVEDEQEIIPLLRRPGVDLSVEDLEASGLYGLGIDLSFLSMVNDVENMETFPPAPLPEYEGMKPNVFDEIKDLHPLGARGSKGHLAEREALALGLSTTRFSKGVFTATDGLREPLLFKWNRNPLVSAVALGMSTHKEATRLQLQRAGVPVPQGRSFRRGDIDSAKAFATRIGYPVVIKPAMGVRGIGVVANIQDEQGFDDAYQLMTESRLGHQDFIVEKHIRGRDYRIVVVGEQVVAAILREPASVVGDGVQTVAELLLNRNSARRKNPHLWARPPQYNAATKYELEKVGMTIDSIPYPGQVVRLGSTNSLSQGGESIAVLEEMHPSILDACIKVVQAIPGMDYCGVDFLLEDHTKPLEGQDAGVCELNAHAAIGNCQYPMFGTPRPVARIVMEQTARRLGLTIRDQPADEVALHVTVRGRLAGSGYERWLRRRAREAGVQGWVRQVASRSMEAVLVGPTVPTTAVVSSMIVGPRRAGPSSYEANHVDVPPVEGFEIKPPPRGQGFRWVGRGFRRVSRGGMRRLRRGLRRLERLGGRS